MSKNEIIEYYDRLNNAHLPRWEELPDFNIYMDQLISLLEKYLSFIVVDQDERIITRSMINNYVKLKLINKPVKKQYNRVHLATLIAITILKQVLTISEIRDGVAYQARFKGYRNAYNYFCVEQEKAFKEALGIVSDDYELSSSLKIEDDSQIVVKLATKAFASKAIASFIVAKQKENKNG